MPVLNMRQNTANMYNQNSFKDEDIILKTPELYYSARGKETLIVEPGTGSWVILDGKNFNILSSIDSPLRFDALLERNKICERKDIENLLLILYKNNIISVNGELYFDEKLFGADYNLLPNFFVILVSDKCNLSCSYCYCSAEQEGNLMSKETLHAVLKRIYEELPFNDSKYTIAFEGGEPLIAMDIIKEAHKCIKILDKKYGKFTRLLCETNGTLLTKENISIFKEMDIRIGVSIDGPRDIHNKFRAYPGNKGSFEDVLRGYRIAQDAGLYPGCTATLHEPEDLITAFKFFTENNIFNFRLGIACSFSGRASLLFYPEDRNHKFAESFLTAVDMALEFNKTRPGVLCFGDLDEMLSNIIVKTREFFLCLRSPCGAGNSIMCFTAEGDIYPCDFMSGEKKLKLGNISDKRPLYKILYESGMVRSLRERTVQNIPKCKKCVWRRFCGSSCAARSYGAYGSMLRESPFCGFFKTVYEKLIWKLHDDESILDFLPKRFALRRR